MKLTKRPGAPSWYVDYTDAAGKRRRVSTGKRDKREALAVARRHIVAAEKEAELSRDGRSPITIAAALGNYVTWLRDNGKLPGASVAELARRRVLGEIAGKWQLDGRRWLHDLRTSDLALLSAARRSEGSSSQTIAHELKTIRAASRRAKIEGYRPADIDDWQLPRVERKTRWLAWREFERLYAELDPDKPITQRGRNGDTVEYVITGGTRRRQRQDAQDLLVALVLCGGRWTEIAGLRWDQIDLDRRTMTIRSAKGAAPRVVGLPSQALAMLSRRRAESSPDDVLVFPGRAGAKRAGPSRAIARAIDACGLNEPARAAVDGRATIHSLRHTFASLLLQRGATLSEVQESLGHATLAMTRRYAHLEQSARVDRLRDLLD